MTQVAPGRKMTQVAPGRKTTQVAPGRKKTQVGPGPKMTHVVGVFCDDFGILFWMWAVLGARSWAGGAHRRQMTRKRRPKAQKWASFWDAFASCRHHFPSLFCVCF